jgi:hypothetical protein
MNQDEVIEKIKKLLRMKRGGTAGEIENALAMAAELARKHGINLGSVDPDEVKQTIRHESDALKSKLTLEAKYAAGILVNFFNVNVLVSQRAFIKGFQVKRQYVVNFVGTEWDIEVARYVFIFLQKHFRCSWARRENRRLKNCMAFLEGMYLGLGYKLSQERETNVDEAGLVLVGKADMLRREYLDKTWPNSKATNVDHDDSGWTASKMAGIQAGKNTNIRKAMDKPAAPARPALPPQKDQMDLL